MDPADFLDQIDLAGQVAPPTRRETKGQRRRVRDRHARWEGGRNAVGSTDDRSSTFPSAGRISRTRSAGTSMPRNPLDCESRSTIGSRRRRLADVDDAGGQFAAGQFENQFAAAAAGPIEPLGIDPALEAVRRIAVQIELPGGVADRDRIEFGRLDETSRVAGEISVSAPPITPPMATGRRASAIMHISGRDVRLVVDRLDRFARQGAADDDLARPSACRSRTCAAAGRIPSARNC